MSAEHGSRRPRAFRVEDADVPPAEPQPAPDSGPDQPPAEPRPPAFRLPSPAEIGRGIRWGGILLAAAAALASIALGVWFARFVSVAVTRDDWIGWLSLTLLGLMAFAALALVLKELIGFFRLTRLPKLRAQAEKVLRERDVKGERATVKAIGQLFERRPELRWHLDRLKEHARDVRDPGDLLRLADRDLMMALDGAARQLVARSAKRTTMVTAISPSAFISVGYVLIENLRLMRGLAHVYGGRPGLIGTARLARMVLTHIVATGGVALTDDLFGQFLGQDLLRRLSRRLGEGIFNGALTARMGVAAIDVIRPMPFIEAPPVRVRDFLGEIMRRPPAEAADAGGKKDKAAPS